MKIPFKFLPQLFNTLYVTAEADINSTEAVVSPDGASGSDEAASSAVVETSDAITDSTAGSATASDVATSTEEIDPLKDVPTVEELKALAEQKVPHAQNLAQLRTAYESLKPQLDEYKTLDPWKPVAQTIGDPALAQSAHELVSAIHTPDPNNPSGFTARPFLERLESESPGAVDQLFADTLTLQITDASGKPTTVVRELVKSWGIDPDRFDDYRNIDKFRASGVVTTEDLGKIPEKYHDAFRSLSSAAREDILSMQESNPAAMEEYLRNAQDALEARTWREKDEQAKAEAQKAEQAKFEKDLEVAVEQDIFAEVRSIHDSIHQNLASQLKFAGDETANNLEYAKIMSTLATLQNPAYRFVAENALKSVGVSLDGFDELANRWSERRSAYKTFDAMGDKWQAQTALSQATIAKQQMLAKLNDYALKLGKASGERAAAAAASTNSQLGAASARFVPAGNGQLPSGEQNPYSQNPHPVGSQEYYAFNRKIDREYSLTGASMFGG